MPKEEKEVILTIGDANLRFTKEGKVWIRFRSGYGTYKIGKTSEEFANTTSWWDIDEIDFGKEDVSKLKKIMKYVDENKPFLLRLVEIILKGSHG